MKNFSNCFFCQRQGGVANNIIPDELWAYFDMRIRLYPDKAWNFTDVEKFLNGIVTSAGGNVNINLVRNLQSGESCIKEDSENCRWWTEIMRTCQQDLYDVYF